MKILILNFIIWPIRIAFILLWIYLITLPATPNVNQPWEFTSEGVSNPEVETGIMEPDCTVKLHLLKK